MRNKKLDWRDIFGTILGILFVLGLCYWSVSVMIGDDTNPQDWTINGTWDKAKSIVYVVLLLVVFFFGLNCLRPLFFKTI